MDKLIEKAKKIKLVITDIDGVWTNGIMYYTNDGDFMKAFSTYDGMGTYILKQIDIPTAIITGEASQMVLKRAEKLKLEDVFIGVMDKLAVFEQLLEKYGLMPEETAYIGDDINDAEVMSVAGLTACPPNSPALGILKPDFITERRGGEGAFREFAELIISAQQAL
ncbi:MAG TPA: acylneuraminate cytidylyltransferase [Candidatus Marinimicrobia bacterium]|nr:acylneuraminate cytidylyltransferase [Candidatus Neomarinimicrobiota bacterium]